MKRVWIGLGIVASLAIAFYASIMLASELGGEIVTIRTLDDSGAQVETRLWVVDDGGFAWLRAGQAQSGWLARIDGRPRIEVERGGRTRAFRAVPVRDPATRDRVHALLAEKYGFADRLISLIRDGSQSVAIRLEPVGGSEG